MKVLLCQDIERLGWLGDVVEVKDGYARNYLLSQGLAVVPTETSIRSLAEEKAGRAAERVKIRELGERASEAVDGAEAVISAKANEAGHLFGSVTESDIAANLRGQGFEVTDEMVKLAGHIKEVGISQVKVKFAEDLTATVTVVVVSEQKDGKDESGPAEEAGQTKD